MNAGDRGGPRGRGRRGSGRGWLWACLCLASVTLLGHLLLLFLRQGHIGERLGLGGDDFVKVDLVHAALVVQVHFSRKIAEVLQNPAHVEQRRRNQEGSTPPPQHCGPAGPQALGT